uniref:Uncharacterized protein n=1 Tax=Pipistrellus kuhlii TaxID=59472 RepID=A0A7J7XC60_PIPKU|nr:hypothetical protein mPipKuh1_010625 [Pipistrellus kuhlii]
MGRAGLAQGTWGPECWGSRRLSEGIGRDRGNERDAHRCHLNHFKGKLNILSQCQRTLAFHSWTREDMEPWVSNAMDLKLDLYHLFPAKETWFLWARIQDRSFYTLTPPGSLVQQSPTFLTSWANTGPRTTGWRPLVYPCHCPLVSVIGLSRSEVSTHGCKGRTDWQLPIFTQYLEDSPNIGGMGKRNCHWKGLHPPSSTWEFKVLLV